MNYQELLERLFALSRFRLTKKELATARTFSTFLSYPESSFPTIHIAGTNGKGSVTTKIAKSCALSGLKTGLYTSPHLFAFEERIQINDRPISREQVAKGLTLLFEIVDREGLKPTFFEIVTYLAFLHFREEKVDIAIIETGMGGRLDATNLVSPLLSVITSISREHVQQLGDSLEQIAFEKAGIIKEKTPVVIGPKALYNAIMKEAEKADAPLYPVEGEYLFYDDENRAVASQALKLLSEKLSLDPSAIQKGVEVRPSCRFEFKEGILYDVAHNPDGFIHLMQALKGHYPDKKFRFLIGMSPAKEVDRCLELISMEAVALHFVQSKDGMTLHPAELAKQMVKPIPTFLEESIESGIKHAKAAALEDELIVVCGSFYIMRESYLGVQS